MLGQIHILGPQHPHHNIDKALKDFCPTGNVAVISAGWRYEEKDIDALKRAIKRDVFHIPLYEWFEGLGGVEPELSNMHKLRQKRILAHKKVYQINLESALQTWHEIRGLYKSNPDIYNQDEHEACLHVQAIDRRCVERLEEIKGDFSAIAQPWLHESALPLFEQIAYTLDRCSALILTGGHVAILRNRLAFFGLEELLQDFLLEGKQIFAWSAGAMCLTDRIVLYHDDPPWGEGYAEILDTGMGLLPKVVFLPHANTRLDIGNPSRIEKFARRFAPDVCICLENGAHLVFNEHGVQDLSAKRSTFQLSVDGTKLALETL